MKIRPEKILIILSLILAGVIIWYNTNIYNAHRTGKLTSEWYLIFLFVPLFVLTINYLMLKRLDKIN